MEKCASDQPLSLLPSYYGSVLRNWDVMVYTVYTVIYVYLIFIAVTTNSTTKNPMLIKFIHMLIITVVDVCAKNWHGKLSI